MEAGEDMSAYKARLVASHIESLLAARAAGSSAVRRGESTGEKSTGGKSTGRPLFVGMQGPQGSGKTTTTAAVQQRLASRGRTSAVFSLDDLYLRHADLVAVAKAHPANALLQGRGQPGTHDVELGTSLLRSLARINDQADDNGSEGASKGDGSSVVHLPCFDKSLHAGQGDRAPSTTSVCAPLDVVIVEGWCMGFVAHNPAELGRRYRQLLSTSSASASSSSPSLPSQSSSPSYTARHPLESLLEINERLRGYAEAWYGDIDAFVQLRPVRLDDVFAWRLEAERAMRAQGKGAMSDDEVHDFVAR